MEKQRDVLHNLMENNAPYSLILKQSQVLDEYIVKAMKFA